MDKIINKISKKIEQVEKYHDKASMLCEDIKDLLAELEENNVENNEIDDFEDEDFDDEEEIDEEEEKE